MSTAVTYEDIRSEIVSWLENNPTFKDYNYTAPAISLLIDALAYVSQQLTQYANFSINECFLDSAQLRHNVVSHAKQVGYIPTQSKTSQAHIRLVSSNSKITETSIIPTNTMFYVTSPATSKAYTFRTYESKYWKRNSDNTFSVDLDLIEGSYVTESFVYNSASTERFFLLNEKIDTDFMKVMVYPKDSTVGFEYTRADSISSFGKDELIYFLEEAYNGKVEIYFGDGKIARKPNEDSTIEVTYLVTSGPDANNLTSFSLSQPIKITDDTILYGDEIRVVVLTQSESGAEKETIESIRFNAPKFFQAQDRAVTTGDYNTLIKHKFGEWISSITSWGGEENLQEPQYARVFICIKPRYVETLSPYQKESIQEFLKKKNLPCIEPIIVDPLYLTMNIDVITDWNSRKSDKTQDEIILKIKETIINFLNNNSDSFKSKLKFSNFVSMVESCDESIDSVTIRFTLEQTLTANIKLTDSYTFNFMNEIEPGTVQVGEWSSTSNKYKYKITDDKNGFLYLYENSVSLGKIGIVDYKNGTVIVQNYKFPSSIYYKSIGNYNIPVTVVAKSQNIEIQKNYLLTTDKSKIKVDINDTSLR